MFDVKLIMEMIARDENVESRVILSVPCRATFLATFTECFEVSRVNES